MAEKLAEKIKTALDETRLLILGAQIVLGFHLNGAFQDGFEELGRGPKLLHAGAFVLMVVTIGLLIAPSMQHRIIERGEASGRIHRATSIFAGLALLPFGASLGLDLFIVLQRHFAWSLAVAVGCAFGALALLFWYLLEMINRREDLLEKAMNQKEEGTPLHAKVEQMLTEARVLLPGAQALLGFQLAVMLTQGFERLPSSSKTIHAVSLCCIALAIILLMTPAAFHRISYGGEDTEGFHRLGSWFVVIAGLPLAAGITGDLYVAVTKAVESPPVGAAVAFFAAAILLVLWYVQPYLLRQKVSPAS
jgi:hypothetical protein